MKRTMLAIAAFAIAMATGTGNAWADGGGQSATGSVGTVQVGQPSVPAASASAPTQAATGGVSAQTAPAASVQPQPANGGSQSASNSAGTVQALPSGTQQANNSTGTAQVGRPNVPAVSAKAPTRAKVGGIQAKANPRVNVRPQQAAAGGSQNARNSTGTVQALGSGPQQSNNSAGTVQVGNPIVPAVSVSAPIAARTGSIRVAGDPALNLQPSATGNGSQSANGSTGTVQAFPGGGTQTADGSALTLQAGQPGLPGITVGGPLSGSTGGTMADTAPVVSVEPTPASNGSQTATDSTGTVQLFPGGGGQSASGSTGTVQYGGGSSGSGTGSGDGGNGGGSDENGSASGTGSSPNRMDVALLSKAAAAKSHRAGEVRGAKRQASARQRNASLNHGVLAALHAQLRNAVRLSGTLPFTGLSLLAALLAALALMTAGALARRTNGLVPDAR
jgi:hypothetical protein